MEILLSEIEVGERKRDAGDVSELAKSIQELGLLNPITVKRQIENGEKPFLLVAGLHRLEAIKLLEWDRVACNVVDLDDLHTELAEIDENIVNKRLTEIEEGIQLVRRKEIYEMMWPETKKGAKNQHTKEVLNDIMSFSKDVSNKTGKNKRSAERSVQIGSNLKPIKEEIEQAGLGDSKTELIELARIAKKEGIETAKEVLEILTAPTNGSENGTKITDSKQTVKTAYREHKRRTESEAAKDIELTHDLIDFRHGRFLEALADVPNESIDLILTDPPYPKEYIDEWYALSGFAARVLKPGGFCIAYSGQLNLPEVMKAMSSQLDYYWTYCLMQSGYAQFITPRNLYCIWKPILIFQNGFSLYKPPKDPLADVIDGSGKAKFSHVWQQGEDELNGLIEHFTNVGDTICDPFAGSGTTLIKAAKMKRNAIGSEMDETHYNNAKRRIEDGVQSGGSKLL